jgi:hypothetical protein
MLLIGCSNSAPSDLKVETDRKIMAIRAETERKLAELKKMEDEKDRARSVKDQEYTNGGRKIHAMHPSWGAIDCNAIASGNVRIGMNAEMVRAAWGKPYRVNNTVSSSGTREQWVMHNDTDSSYAYFENGILTSIQNATKQ